MSTNRNRISIIAQVTMLIAICTLATGILTLFTQRARSELTVKAQTEELAEGIAEQTELIVREYPAFRQLMQYWYEHPDEMDIEYDATFATGEKTSQKCRILTGRHPNMVLQYVTKAQFEALPAADQKLYAEITYSWLITRINELKRIYNVSFLFCVLTDESYEGQFFLFSAADPGAVRGTNYEEVYPLGVQVTVSESQQEAMRQAKDEGSYLADAGKYLDYYVYLDEVAGHPVLIGLTYDLSALLKEVDAETAEETGMAMAYQVVLSALFLLIIYLYILKPLRGVQQNIRLYRETKDSETVIRQLGEVRSHNEIGELADDVSDLAGEIDDYLGRIQEITAEKERIGAELSLATRIQKAMLPSTFPPFPERTEFDIFASMDPAKEVGGDFYDFFLVDEDHLVMVIADVSGKGVPAALFMMASKIILANNAEMKKSPAQILADTNAMICANNPEEMFVTVWLGILEISTGKLTAANAGHEYPVLRKADGSFELYKDKHGFVIGGMAGMKYREYEIELEPGAKLFLYTDGVPEATCEEGSMFGMERLLEALNEDVEAAPEQILRNTRRAVDAFVKEAEQFDDLTMMCLEYKGCK